MISPEVENPGPPTRDVLAAFETNNEPIRVAGGQGQNYRSGDIILKPALDNDETDWLANFYLETDLVGIRLPQPICSVEGGFVYHGWQAWANLAGEHRRGCWEEVVEVCIRFHQGIADLPKPDYFDHRDQNPWVVADKAAWGEIEIKHHQRTASVVQRMKGCLRKIEVHQQLIHGDFGGNVLFADHLSPAVIDFSPYWRPVPFAVGIVIADAIVWESADMSLIAAGARFKDFHQHLLRAELRRVIELELLYQQYGWDVIDQIGAHLGLIDTVCSLCS